MAHDPAFDCGAGAGLRFATVAEAGFGPIVIDGPAPRTLIDLAATGQLVAARNAKAARDAEVRRRRCAYRLAVRIGGEVLSDAAEVDSFLAAGDFDLRSELLDDALASAWSEMSRATVGRVLAVAAASEAFILGGAS